MAELSVDIGGTFTDVVLQAGTDRSSVKVLTSYEDPALAVLEGIGEVLASSGINEDAIDLVLHGTTLATNALIERSGAVTALLTTRGHRDVLEMALENRFEQYDLNIDRPVPLVPRHLRLPVIERLDARGQVLIDLDEASVERLLPVLENAGIESVAIGFLHAYRNPVHEERVAEILERGMPGVSLSLSSAVCPEIREYERLSTTCANAYVKPLMSRYLESLESRLNNRGIRAPVLLMTSGGGLTTLQTAKAFPIRLVESGPAGGAILAGRIARAGGCEKALSFDMGGTTAKLCVIDAGEPLTSRAFEVDRSYRFRKGSGLPVRIPVIEMVEIGAGGGSIAGVDNLGRLRVGPESAASDPGPACYGKGGCLPTVTDADLLLGRIRSKDFSGGRMLLDTEAAARALDQKVAQPLRLALDLAAHALCEVVDENMVAAARAHLGEWGKGSEGRVLIAFGGAAPLHACALAGKLKLDRVIVPKDAGVGSAVGFLLAPVSFEVVRSHYSLLSDFAAETAATLLDEMHQEALAVVAAVAGGVELWVRVSVYMRYVGQGYEIAIQLPDRSRAALEADALRRQFERAYTRLYGRVIEGLDVEVLSWTLSVGRPNPVEDTRDRVSVMQVPEPFATHRLYDGALTAVVEAGCYQRERLGAGDCLQGPALVIESQTTTYVATGYQATVSEQGHLVVETCAGVNTDG
ncbi:MAG: hydantoinase/oxoprolinase family protein [Pseudomonadales bacterium]|nr:hydantoinase/oxoprolinase family protein [Pseudomonadales bacterium]